MSSRRNEQVSVVVLSVGQSAHDPEMKLVEQTFLASSPEEVHRKCAEAADFYRKQGAWVGYALPKLQ
mgnify:CR=1 FL=1